MLPSLFTPLWSNRSFDLCASLRRLSSLPFLALPLPVLPLPTLISSFRFLCFMISDSVGAMVPGSFCGSGSGSSSDPDISDPSSSVGSSVSDTVDLRDRLLGLPCDSAESESGSDFTSGFPLFLLFTGFDAQLGP